MKKLLLVVVSLLLFVNASVFATSWADIEPQVVIDNAEVIITGQYDFTSKPVRGNSIFEGYDFQVKHAYQGEVAEKITVGIDQYDVNWAEQFQSTDGQFLLFLTKGVEDDFLVPYSGPNGMIRIVDGKVVAGEGKNKPYQAILDSTPVQTFDHTIESNIENNTVDSNSILIIGISVLGGLAILFLLYRFFKRK